MHGIIQMNSEIMDLFQQARGKPDDARAHHATESSHADPKDLACKTVIAMDRYEGFK